MIRVAVVDDQELTREGFSLILDAQPDLEVVGVATDGAEAVALVRAHAPDVVLMDVRMAVMDGVEATRHITGLGTGSRVLVLTTFDLDEYVYAALRAGASGFLLKDAPRATLIEAVRCVHAGEVVLAPDVTRRLVEAYVARGAVRPDPALARLSPREAETLALVAQGRSNAEIAGQLFLSEATVKTHVARVLAKLSLRDRVQAVVYAYEHGIVAPGATGRR